MEYNCSTCHEAITGIEHIACKGVCSKRFHTTCTSLSKSLARQMDAHSKNLFWFCDDCAALFSNPSFRSVACNAPPESNELAQLTNAITELRSQIQQLAPKPIRTPMWNKSTPTPTPTPLRRPLKRARVPDAVSTEPCQLGSKHDSNDLVSIPLCEDENPKLFWIYLSRIKPEVTEDAVKTMVQANLGVEDATVVKLVPRGSDISSFRFISFKVGISPDSKPRALNSESWPKGLYFREFMDYNSKQFRDPQ